MESAHDARRSETGHGHQVQFRHLASEVGLCESRVNEKGEETTIPLM